MRPMTRLRIARASRAGLLAALALGLLAGPAAAACTSCCPEAGDPISVVSVPACCGDCSASMEPSAQPSTQTVRGVVTIASPLLALPLDAGDSTPRPAAILHAVPEPRARCGPAAALAPLRL